MYLLLGADAGTQDDEHRGGVCVHRLPPEALSDHAHRHQRQAGGQRLRFGQGGWGDAGGMCLQTFAKDASGAFCRGVWDWAAIDTALYR